MRDFKPLLKLGPYRAVEHAVRCFLHAGVCDVRVVVGFRAEKIVEAVNPLGVAVVCNPDFDLGMYSSVQAGLKTLEPGVRAFFILPADHPLIAPVTIKKMLNCRLQGQHSIVYPVFNGKRGHPPLISTKYKDDIVSGACPDGLQGFLSKYGHEAYDLEVPDKAVLLDMDTPEDYLYLQSYHRRKSIPTLDECRRILHETGVGERVKEHCSMVAVIAKELAGRLNKAGAGLDKDLIMAGALLHDLARSEPDHAQAGASLLESRGYPLVASVVGAHMDIEADESYPLTEAEVVFLADKMVKGKYIVSVKDRFAAALEKYKGDPQACAAVAKRLKQAERIMLKIEKITGRSIESVPLLDIHLKNGFCEGDEKYA
jgi:putative nucleotidyltransferase with HDIG domain